MPKLIEKIESIKKIEKDISEKKSASSKKFSNNKDNDGKNEVKRNEGSKCKASEKLKNSLEDKKVRIEDRKTADIEDAGEISLEEIATSQMVVPVQFGSSLSANTFGAETLFAQPMSQNLEVSLADVETDKKEFAESDEKKESALYQEALYSEARELYENEKRKINVGREAMPVGIRHEDFVQRPNVDAESLHGRKVQMANLSKPIEDHGYEAYLIEKRNETQPRAPWEHPEEKQKKYKS